MHNNKQDINGQLMKAQIFTLEQSNAASLHKVKTILLFTLTLILISAWVNHAQLVHWSKQYGMLSFHLYCSHKSITAGQGGQYATQEPMISGQIIVNHEYYVSRLNISFLLQPLASPLQSRQVFLRPSFPEHVCQVLNLSSTASAVHVLLDKHTGRSSRSGPQLKQMIRCQRFKVIWIIRDDSQRSIINHVFNDTHQC